MIYDYMINKYLELYRVFVHNFLCQNVQIFPFYILLTRRINTFWSKSIDKFWSGGIKTFWVQKLWKKNRQNSQRFLNYTKSSYVPKCFDTS